MAPCMSKPFKKLKRGDLESAPVWEWLPDDGAEDADPDADESYVQPTSLTELPLGSFGQFIVAAQISLKHGEPLPGIAEVTIASDETVVRPAVVFLLDRQLQIPSVETNRLLARFTKTAQNCPVGWQLRIRLQGEPEVRSGQIKGGDMADVVRAGLEALLALKALRK